MTASDHATKPLRNTLRERGRGYAAPDDALASWRVVGSHFGVTIRLQENQ
jgi:hypothetical protein